VLCYLEGRTHAEAARELGCPKGTVGIRLLRARKLLQARLTRRGVTLATAVLIAAAAPPASAALVAHTLRRAFGGPVPVRVTALTEGVIRAMSMTRLKVFAAMVFALAVGVLGAGSVVLSRAAPPGEAPREEPARPAPPAASLTEPPAPPAAAPEKKKESRVVRVPSLRDGQILVIGTEIPSGEVVPADRRITANVGYFRVRDGKDWRPYREGEPLPANAKYLQLQRVKKEFKRLEIGDEVKAGQTVALVDPILALGEVDIKIAGVDAAESDARAARKTKEEAERRVAAMEESNRRVPGSVSKDDYEGAKLTAKRYTEEEVAKNCAVIKTQQELIQAATILSMHEIHAPISGFIRDIDRLRGEAVRALETVLVLGTTRDDRPAGRGENIRDLRTPREGVLTLVGTEIKNGEAVPADQVVIVGTGGAAKRYRPLRDGDAVAEGQLLARLDDRLARTEIALAEARIVASKAEASAARQVREEADRRVASFEESMRRVPGSVSKDDYEGARLTAKRYFEEEIARNSAVHLSTVMREQLTNVLQTYEMHSPVRGVVRELLKFPGEAVRAGDPVLRIVVVPGP
jgi:multidrug resistance efflux pump